MPPLLLCLAPKLDHVHIVARAVVSNFACLYTHEYYDSTTYCKEGKSIGIIDINLL